MLHTYLITSWDKTIRTNWIVEAFNISLLRIVFKWNICDINTKIYAKRQKLWIKDLIVMSYLADNVYFLSMEGYRFRLVCCLLLPAVQLATGISNPSWLSLPFFICSCVGLVDWSLTSNFLGLFRLFILSNIA